MSEWQVISRLLTWGRVRCGEPQVVRVRLAALLRRGMVADGKNFSGRLIHILGGGRGATVAQLSVARIAQCIAR